MGWQRVPVPDVRGDRDDFGASVSRVFSSARLYADLRKLQTAYQDASLCSGPFSSFPLKPDPSKSSAFSQRGRAT